MVFWCLRFSPKNEQKQVDLRYHSSKVEFLHSFFGRNWRRQKPFRNCLTFSKCQNHDDNFAIFLWLSQKSWTLLFQSHHFKVQTLVETPYTISLDLNDKTEKYEVTGSFPDLLNSLANTMNFTYTIGPPPDMKWGGQQENGSWNGMMDQVVKEEIDFGKLFTIITFLLESIWSSLN